MQSDNVKRHFNLTKFIEGTYYEVAAHDYTQYPVCPSPSCITLTKTLDRKLNQINGTFDLRCVGKYYHNTGYFKLTDIPGHFNGTWNLIPEMVFPDTVVDFYENSDGVYQWVIELQCVEKFDHVWFVGINWYSRVNNTEPGYLKTLLDAARARGLGLYMDKGEKIYYVNQTKCG